MIITDLNHSCYVFKRTQRLLGTTLLILSLIIRSLLNKYKTKVLDYAEIVVPLLSLNKTLLQSS